jgi:hypothetical protein
MAETSLQMIGNQLFVKVEIHPAGHQTMSFYIEVSFCLSYSSRIYKKNTIANARSPSNQGTQQ